MFMQHEIAGAERAYAFTVGHGGAILARTLREAVEIEAQRLVDWLDDLDADPDLEPYLAGTFGDDRETDDGDEGEVENEHGGDVQDQPHDAEDEDAAEDSDHSGCGDYGGMSEQLNGDVDLGATEDMNHDLAWADPDPTSWGCADGEPSLGWSENHGAGHSENQLQSPRDDREDDAGDNGELDDDRELEPDDEIGTGALRGGGGL